jgi:hypothetical protein
MLKGLLRILCALAVFFTSAIFLLGINYAAHRLPIHTAKYALAMAMFIDVGILSLSGIYFILNSSRA